MRAYLPLRLPAGAQTREGHSVQDTGQRVKRQTADWKKHLQDTRLMQDLYPKHAKNSFKTALLSYNSHTIQFTHF